MLSVSNQMSTCVAGLPLFSWPEWPESGFQGSKREKETKSAPNYETRRKKTPPERFLKVLDFCLCLNLCHSDAREAPDTQSSLPDDKREK